MDTPDGVIDHRLDHGLGPCLHLRKDLIARLRDRLAQKPVLRLLDHQIGDICRRLRESRWRKEQEAKLRVRTAPSDNKRHVMTDDEIDRFVQHYERLTRHIIEEMPSRADAVVQLGSNRELKQLDFS